MITLASARSPIKNPDVMNATLALPGVKSLPWIASRAATGDQAQWLAQKVEVRGCGRDGDAELVRIGMKGDDPEQLAALVNAVSKAYVDRIVGEERKMLQARRDVLDQNYKPKLEEVNRRRDLVHHQALKDSNRDTEEMLRHSADLAAVVKTADKLRAALEECERTLQDPPRVTLVTEAPIPNTPLTP